MIVALQCICGSALVAFSLTGTATSLISAAEPAVAITGQAVDPEGEALKEKVITGIRRNYAKLPSVRCRQVTTSVDPRVKKREVIRGKTDGGAEFEATVSPKTTTETDLILVAGNMRADSIDPDTNERWSVSMHNGIWTSFYPTKNFARRKYREELGGEMNIDPRNVGAWEQKKEFLEELERYRVERHETVERGGAERLVLHLSETFPQAGLTVTTRFEFDAARNYLPARIVGEDPQSGKIAWVHDFEYQEMVPKEAWFLKKSRLRFFADSKPKTPDGEGWTQQMIQLVGAVRIDESFAESAFDIDIPAGTNYIDQTIGRARPVEEAPAR